MGQGREFGFWHRRRPSFSALFNGNHRPESIKNGECVFLLDNERMTNQDSEELVFLPVPSTAFTLSKADSKILLILR